MFYFHYQELFVSNNTSHNPLLLNKPFMVMLLFGIFLFVFVSLNCVVLVVKSYFKLFLTDLCTDPLKQTTNLFKHLTGLFFSKLKIKLINSIIIITKTTTMFSSTVNRES